MPPMYRLGRYDPLSHMNLQMSRTNGPQFVIHNCGAAPGWGGLSL